MAKREYLPNKRINLSRPTVSVVTSGRSPRRLCAVRFQTKGLSNVPDDLDPC